MNEFGVLRVYGRLHNADISFEAKRPIILAHDGLLAELIMKQTHIKCLHGDKSLMVATSREEYWITQSANVAKKVVNGST